MTTHTKKRFLFLRSLAHSIIFEKKQLRHLPSVCLPASAAAVSIERGREKKNIFATRKKSAKNKKINFLFLSSHCERRKKKEYLFIIAIDSFLRPISAFYKPPSSSTSFLEVEEEEKRWRRSNDKRGKKERKGKKKERTRKKERKKERREKIIIFSSSRSSKTIIRLCVCVCS